MEESGDNGVAVVVGPEGLEVNLGRGSKPCAGDAPIFFKLVALSQVFGSVLSK